MGDQSRHFPTQPSTSPSKPQTRVLARGVWLQTVRCGDDVRRSPQPWCPAPLGTRLLLQLIRGADRFGRYLPVPPLRLVDGRGGPALLQPYLAGAVPLRRLTTPQLADPLVRHSLLQFWQAAAQGWRNIGWLPDIGGRAYLPWELYRPLQSDNVLIDRTGNCWLVDVGASATFHSVQSPLGRLHAALMLRAIRNCVLRLGAVRREPWA